MTHCAGIAPAAHAAASPVGSEPIRSTSARRAATWSGPPARRIAPSTPPPPIRPLLAALTTASTSCSTMSPATILISTRRSLPVMGTLIVRAYGDAHKTVEGRTLDEVSDLLAITGATLWVDLEDPSPDDMETLAGELGLHHLAVEDAIERHQRDKYVHYDDHLFLVCHAVELDAEETALRTEEIDVFIGDRWLVTVHDGRRDLLERAATRWSQEKTSQHGVGLLVYG